MPTIGFLHTADVPIARFDRLVAERAPGAGTVAFVHAPMRVRSSPSAAVEAALAYVR